MTTYRSKLFRHGDRWLSEGELKRLELDESPEAARRRRRLEHRAGKVKYRTGWSPSTTSWTEYDNKKTFQAAQRLINSAVERWHSHPPWRDQTALIISPDDARYYFMVLRGKQNVSGSTDLPGYWRNNETAREKLFRILRHHSFWTETRPGQPKHLAKHFPGAIMGRAKGGERILMIGHYSNPRP